MRSAHLAALAVIVAALTACGPRTYVNPSITPEMMDRQRAIDDGRCTAEAYDAIPAPSGGSRVFVNTAPPSGGGFAGGFADGFARAQANRGTSDTGYSDRETIKKGCMARLGWVEERR